MKRYAIIVAGGSGTRMKSEMPKQFLRLHKEPIIIHTIRQFIKADEAISIVVVLPEKHLGYWREMVKDYPFTSSIKVAAGGTSRTQSVRSGLKMITGDGLVAIHDAVRPFISPGIIIKSFESAAKRGSGVAAVSLKDSIREVVNDERSIARDRNSYVLVQTPQTFQVAKIKQSYEIVRGDFTDDATVFEQADNDVFLVEGSYANIKITTPEDLK